MTALNKIYIFFAISIPILLSISLQFLPLTNTLGFEFSFLLSFPLFFSGGLIAIFNPTQKIKHISILIAVAVPFFISLCSNIFFSVCPISIDLLFYFVIPIPALIIGYLWGIFIYKNIRYVRFGYLFVSFQILLIFPFLEFYFLPQIYFYNPVFGYFPGTIYDQHIAITWDLVLYRVLIIFLFYLFSKMNCSKKEKSYRSLIIIPIFLAVWFMILKPWFGFSTTEGKIEDELTQVLKTEHFEIFTDKEMKYDTTSLKYLHEFYYNEIDSQLALENNVKIKSYIFKNRIQKKELFGSENADVAKPWMKQIYLDEQNFTRSLKHELVHILSGEFGNKPFDVAANVNPSLIEGLAMAVENNYDDKEIDYIVSLAVDAGYATELAQLFSGLNFFGSVSSKSYLYAGSFIKYLMNTYGIEPVKKLYKEGDFLSSIGKSIDALEIEYNTYLKSLNYIPNKETAKLYFGMQPLIKKTCPRVAARVEREGWEFYRVKKYDAALEKFEFVFNSTGSYSSFNGILLSKIQLGHYKTALNLAEENLSIFENTSYFYNLELRIADLSILNSDSLNAIKKIELLLKQNPSVNYYNEAVMRNLLIRKGVEYYSDFLLADSQKRILMLGAFIDDEGFDSVIPEIIEYSKNIDEGIEALENILSKYSLSGSREGIYAAVKLSEYFYSLGVLNKAEYYSDFAYTNNRSPEFNAIVRENFNLIKWSMVQH